ncbi:unnamed protein product [Mucor hiemalis]
MDDMYQYAASAVDNNNKKPNNNVPEEEDVILKAFNNMGWGRKWSSLVDTVKRQSEAFVEGTKKDLQEFAQVLTEDEDPNSVNNNVTINEDGQAISRSVEDNNTENDISPMDAIRENLAKINTVNFTSLRDGLTHTLNQTLPSQITSVRLPENMDLTQLKEGLANGTRSAEHYLQQFGTDVISALKGTVTVLSPEEEGEAVAEGASRDVKDSNSPRIFGSRKEALIAKMQTNESTYLTEPELSQEEKKVLDTFNSSFKIDEYTDEIAQLLNDHPDLRETMDKLVPVQVSYTLFWQHYFYQAWKIEQDEQKRQLIVQGADEAEDEADFKWDSDEEDNTPSLAPSSSTATITKKEDVKKPVIEKEEESKKSRLSSSNSEDTDDFSNISESPTMKSSQTEDEWVKAEKKKSDEEDSDSDWE